MKPKGIYIILSLSLYFAVLFPMQLQSQEQTLFSSNLPWFSNQVNINGQITEKPNLPLPDFAYMELNVVEFSSGNSFSLSTQLHFDNDCFFRLLDNPSGPVATSDSFTFSADAEFSYPEDGCITNDDLKVFQQAHIDFFKDYMQQPFNYQIEKDETTGDQLTITNSNGDSIEFTRVKPYEEFASPEILLKKWKVDHLVINSTIHRVPEIQKEDYDFEATFYNNSIDLQHCYFTSFSTLFEKESNVFHITNESGTLGNTCNYYYEVSSFDSMLSSFFSDVNKIYTYTLQYPDPPSEGDHPTGLVLTNLENDSLILSAEGVFSVTPLQPYIYQFPNPVQDELLINLDAAIHKVVIYDLYGSKILESRQKKIDVIGLSKGLYLVKISSTAGMVTKKMIKS